MFGKNRIRGRRTFNEAGDRLLVTSCFITLQGEGPFAGRPAVFVRLAYCNLACSFCDTFFDDGDWYTVEELSKLIGDRLVEYFGLPIPDWATYAAPSVEREMVLVVTGGEPSLQNNLGCFLQVFEKQFENVQIESNGLLLPQNLPDTVTLVVSPKCLEKDGRPTHYTKLSKQVIDRINYLKFVICADEDSPYHAIPDWALKLRGQIPIYVSPMNEYARYPQAIQKLQQEQSQRGIDERSTVEEKISFWEPGLLDLKKVQANHEHAAKYALANGLILSLQLHLFANLP